MNKTCGICEKTDGLCYISNPPKCRCNVTGEFHTYDHECDVERITMSEWISVKEDLPEPGKRVLFSSDKFVGEAYLSSANTWYRHAGFLLQDVTHWMPLPKPPEEGTDLSCQERVVSTMTNADRIRAMSDEELSELLWGASWQMPVYEKCLKWLQQPAEED